MHTFTQLLHRPDCSAANTEHRPASGRLKRVAQLVAVLMLFSGVHCVLVSTAAAQLSAEDVVRLEQVSSVAMHPGGVYVAYTLVKPRTADEPVGRDYSELWVLNTQSGEQQLIVGAPRSAFAPSWIPGTERVAFQMADAEWHPRVQVFAATRTGAELEMLTTAPEGVIEYVFSDRADRFAYTMRRPLTEQEQRRHEQGFDMQVAGEGQRHVRLWVQQGEQASAVTPEDMSVWDMAFAPGGTRLAARLTWDTGIDYEMLFSEIYEVDALSGDMELLAISQGKVGAMAWSPDGAKFAFLAAKAINDPLPQRIYVVERGEVEPRDITPETFAGTPEWLAWRDNATLLFAGTEGTRTGLRVISAGGGDAELLVGGGAEVFRSVSIDANWQRLAAPVQRSDHPAEVYVTSLLAGDWERLTHHNDFLADRRLGRQQTIEWESVDGMRIEGVLTWPVNYQAGQSYPLAILPHGGPEGVSLDGWTTRPLYPAQVLAAEGYMVLEPNYRGSGGLGSAMTMANHRDLGGKEFEDVIAGIDHLAFRGLVNPRQVGISGTSYGGYFSAWAATRHSDRFAAGITFAGLSNWISFMGTTDIPHEMSITHWDLWWFDNPGLVWDRSPVAWMNQANTPLLVVHGLADDRVHPEQSIQLYQFLKLRGIPSGLVLYPRQPHGLVERAHRLDFMERVVDWFNRYVATAD